MNFKAEAGKCALLKMRDKYRLNMLQNEDDSPALVLAAVTVVDGHEEFSPIAELDMSDIYTQIFDIFAYHE